MRVFSIVIEKTLSIYINRKLCDYIVFCQTSCAFLFIIVDSVEPHLVHGVGDFVESFGPESGVHVECDACGGMAELFL